MTRKLILTDKQIVSRLLIDFFLAFNVPVDVLGLVLEGAVGGFVTNVVTAVLVDLVNVLQNGDGFFRVLRNLLTQRTAGQKDRKLTKN